MEHVGWTLLVCSMDNSGNCYLLVAMDYFTKWTAAYAALDKSAVTVVEKLMCDMFCQFGAPQELDQTVTRSRTESQVFMEMYQWMGVNKTQTTPFHPQSDRIVEQFNQTFVTQLAIITFQHQRD